MTEEIRTEEIKECKCCECREKLVKGLKEFAFKAAIVYVGVILAILTSATVLKPKHCPCARMKHHPAIERQMPDRMMNGPMDRGLHNKKHKFNRQNRPENFAEQNFEKARRFEPPVDKQQQK